mmetsp:Transcript_32421/g.44536  ORF Transcript_32421/g.44536 Transcript_32421/m.44536 type:complete len:227 (+) Transcript_32421:44-724(+)
MSDASVPITNLEMLKLLLKRREQRQSFLESRDLVPLPSNVVTLEHHLLCALRSERPYLTSDENDANEFEVDERSPAGFPPSNILKEYLVTVDKLLKNRDLPELTPTERIELCNHKPTTSEYVQVCMPKRSVVELPQTLCENIATLTNDLVRPPEKVLMGNYLEQIAQQIQKEAEWNDPIAGFGLTGLLAGNCNAGYGTTSMRNDEILDEGNEQGEYVHEEHPEHRD